MANDNKPPLGARIEQGLRALDGKIVDMAEAAGILNDKQRQLNDATRMALIVSRLTRALGHRVDQRLALAACYVIVAKLIMHSSPEKHGALVQAAFNGIGAALWGLYSPEMRALIEQQVRAEAELARDNLKSGPPPSPQDPNATPSS